MTKIVNSSIFLRSAEMRRRPRPLPVRMAFWILALLQLLTPQININVEALPILRALDMYSSFIFIFALIVAGIRYKVDGSLISSICSIMVVIAYLLCLELIFQSGDLTGLMAFGRMIVTVLAAYGFSLMLLRIYGSDAVFTFIKIIIFAACVQGAVLWLSFLIPDARDVLSIFFARDASEGREHLVQLRVPGFAMSGGDGLSMNQALLSVIGMIGVRHYYRPMKLYYVMIFGIVAALVSTAFTGRSGLYLGAFWFILFFIMPDYTARSFSVTRLLGLVSVVCVTFFLLEATLQLAALGLYDEFGYEHPLVRIFIGIMDAERIGLSPDDTLSTLLHKMIIIPDEVIRFLFGTGDFGQLEYTFIESDVGYIRMWHGFGLIGLVFVIVFIFGYPVVRVLGTLRSMNSPLISLADARMLQVVLTMVFVFGFIGHYKILFLTSRIFVFILFAILYLVLLSKNEHKWQFKPALSRSRAC